MHKRVRKNALLPVENAARSALEQIRAWGLPTDLAENIVGRVFSHPLQDAMEINHREGVSADPPKGRKRHRHTKEKE